MESRIVGQGNQGQFVHDNQGMAVKEGFRNVSKSWWDKTISYDEGMEMLEDDRGHRQDYLVNRSQMSFDVREVGGKFHFGIETDDQFYVPNDHALDQIVKVACNGKGTAFVRSLRGSVYDRNQSKDVQRDFQDMSTILSIVRNGIRRQATDKKYKLRCYDNGSMRAFLSEKYAEVDNRWYLEQLKQIIPAGRLSHWRGDSDTVFGNVLIPDTIREEDDSDYGGMVSIGNCEIGKRAVSSLPSVFRAICMNGCIWDQTKGSEIKVRHIGDIDLSSLASKIRTNIEAQIPLLPMGIERILGIRAKGTDGVAMKSLIAGVSKKEGIDKRGSKAILEAWQKYEKPIAPEERSLFDIVNSITRAGQFLDNQTWLNFDKLGGRLVNYTDRQWESVKAFSADLEDTDFKKIYSSNSVLSA